MPFDYEEYQKKVNTLTTEQLHREWENYTRQISGGATSTATSVLFSPLTGGISLIGLGLSAPRIHNARKKREIIEAGLQARGTTHNTRKRDVVTPMAIAGTFGGLTLGLAGPGADMIAGEVVGHGVEYAVSHAALDATGAVLEHKHDEHSKKKVDQKLKTQYQNFVQQYQQNQATLPGQPVTSTTTPQQAPRVLTQLDGAPLQVQTQMFLQDNKDTLGALYNPSIAPQQEVVAPQYQTQQPWFPGDATQQSEKYLYSPYSPLLAQTTNATGSPCPSPLPLAQSSILPGQQSVTSLQPNLPFEHSSGNTSQPQKVPAATAVESDPPPPPPTLEEEIEFLKARLLQMEIEKRAAAQEKDSAASQAPQVTETQKSPFSVDSRVHEQRITNLTIPPPPIQSQPHQYDNTPSASPVPQSIPPALPTPHYFPQPLKSPQPQQQGYFPPPPPPPPPPQQFLAPYQPSHYPPPPPLPSQNSPITCQQPQKSQQYPPQQQPQFQRQDSGYYSTPQSQVTSPLTNGVPQQQQQYTQPQQLIAPQSTGYSILTPQSTGFSTMAPQSTGNTSISSYQPYPQAAPPQYYPPPPDLKQATAPVYQAVPIPPSYGNPGQEQRMQDFKGQPGASVGCFPPPPPSGPVYRSG